MYHVIFPMGCKMIDKESELEKILNDDDYIGQRKIKGIRTVMHVLDDGTLKFTTRGTSLENPDEPIDITHRLPHLTKYKLEGLEGLILDGEMWSPDLDDSEIAGKLNYKATVPVPTSIQPYFFDIVSDEKSFLSNVQLRNRLQSLKHFETMFDNYEELSWAHFVPYVTGQDKRKFLYEILESGGEGMVFKNLNSTYLYTTKNAKRAGYWYKYKRKDTIDAIITGATAPEQFYRDPSTGDYDITRFTKPFDNGWIGSLNFQFEVSGQLFSGSCAGMSDETKILFSDGHCRIKPEFIGRTIEVEFFERNKLGNCEHPRFIRLREEIEK